MFLSGKSHLFATGIALGEVGNNVHCQEQLEAAEVLLEFGFLQQRMHLLFLQQNWLVYASVENDLINENYGYKVSLLLILNANNTSDCGTIYTKFIVFSTLGVTNSLLAICRVSSCHKKHRNSHKLPSYS